MMLVTQRDHALRSIVMLHCPRWIKMVAAQEGFSASRRRTPKTYLFSERSPDFRWNILITHECIPCTIGSGLIPKRQLNKRTNSRSLLQAKTAHCLRLPFRCTERPALRG